MTGFAIGAVLLAAAGWALLELSLPTTGPRLAAVGHVGATEAWSPLAEVTGVPLVPAADAETLREHLAHDAEIAAELTAIEGALSDGLAWIVRWTHERLNLDAETLLTLAGVTPALYTGETK